MKVYIAQGPAWDGGVDAVCLDREAAEKFRKAKWDRVHDYEVQTPPGVRLVALTDADARFIAECIRQATRDAPDQKQGEEIAARLTGKDAT